MGDLSLRAIEKPKKKNKGPFINSSRKREDGLLPLTRVLPQPEEEEEEEEGYNLRLEGGEVHKQEEERGKGRKEGESSSSSSSSFLVVQHTLISKLVLCPAWPRRQSLQLPRIFCEKSHQNF